jgi:hypothetical protein
VNGAIYENRWKGREQKKNESQGKEKKMNQLFAHACVHWHPAYSPYWSPFWGGSGTYLEKDIYNKTKQWFDKLDLEEAKIWRLLASETLFMLKCAAKITNEELATLRRVAEEVMHIPTTAHLQRTYEPWGIPWGLYRCQPDLFSPPAWTQEANKVIRRWGIPSELVCGLCETLLLDVRTTLLDHKPGVFKCSRLDTVDLAEHTMQWYAVKWGMGEIFPGILDKRQTISFTATGDDGLVTQQTNGGDCHHDVSTRADIVQRYTKEALAWQDESRIEINLLSPFVASYPDHCQHCRLSAVIIHENFHLWCNPQTNLLLTEGLALYGEMAHLGRIYGSHEFRYGIYALAERLVRPLVDRGMYTSGGCHMDALEIIRDLFGVLLADNPPPSLFAGLDVMKAIECRSRYLPGNAYGYSTGWLLLLSLRNAILIRMQITANNNSDNLVPTLISFHSVLREESSETVVKLLQALDRVFKCNLCRSIKPLNEELNDAMIIDAALQAYHCTTEGGALLPALRIDFKREPTTPYARLLYPVVVAA